LTIAGIVLVVLQNIVLIGSLISGENPFPGGIFGALGYCSAGTAGVILLIVDAVKNNKKKNQENGNKADKSVSKKTEDTESDAPLASYRMNGNLQARYTRMFRQPFSQVIREEACTIQNKRCAVYTFQPNYARSQLCAFQHLFVVPGIKTRYFAVEYSYENQYYLCEWVFEGEKEKILANYGEISSLNTKECVVEKLNEILTKQKD